MNTKEKLLHEMRSNETVLQIFSAEDIAREWEQLRGPTRTAANFVAPTLDAITLSKMIRELGLMGRFVTKKVGEKTYVILKGSPGSRRILRGTRYLASNPKVVRFAIGPKGVLKSVKGGAVLTAVLFTGINILEYFLKDSVKLHTLLGTLSSDLIQIGISSLCAALAGLAVGAAAVVPTVAGAPLFAAIAVGVLTGFVLSAIDERTGATSALIDFYEEVGIELTSTWDELMALPGNIAREIARWERHMTNRAIRRQVHGY